MINEVRDSVENDEINELLKLNESLEKNEDIIST